MWKCCFKVKKRKRERKKSYTIYKSVSQTRDWFLLVRSDPGSGSGSGSGVFSYYVLQSSGSLSLLLKPVLTRELMLPCSLPVSMEDPPLPALATVEVPLHKGRHLMCGPDIMNNHCLKNTEYLTYNLSHLESTTTPSSHPRCICLSLVLLYNCCEW